MEEVPSGDAPSGQLEAAPMMAEGSLMEKFCRKSIAIIRRGLSRLSIELQLSCS